jgi:phosphate starvation-inducible PhoH-like protein
MRSTLTRIGENSKMIITGDTKQIDIKIKRLSSLDTVIRMFSEKSGVGTLLFETKDIVEARTEKKHKDTRHTFLCHGSNTVP